MLSPAPAVHALFVAGVAAAVVATLVMDVVMARLPEGETPPFVASGVLTGSHPDDAPAGLANVVHYVAGLLTGALFAWLVLAAASLLDGALVVVATAAVVHYVLMVGFFVIVVLPRSQVERERVSCIRRDWAIDAGAYLAVLVPVVGVAATML